MTLLSVPLKVEIGIIFLKTIWQYIFKDLKVVIPFDLVIPPLEISIYLLGNYLGKKKKDWAEIVVISE